MTLSNKILLSYLALGGGVGGIYIGVNGGIGNKAIEEVEKVDEAVDAPNAVEPKIAPEKTEESVEEKTKGTETEENPEVKTTEQEGSTLTNDGVKETKANEEMKESTANDETTGQTKTSDNSEDVGQEADLELRVIEAVASTDIEIQVVQEMPEIKHKALKIDTNLIIPEKTKGNIKSEPIEAPVSNQTIPKTKATSDGTPNPSDGEKTGMAWIMGKAREYADQRQQLTTIIRAVKSYLG